MDVQEVRSRSAGVILKRWAGDRRLRGVEGTLSNSGQGELGAGRSKEKPAWPPAKERTFLDGGFLS